MALALSTALDSRATREPSSTREPARDGRDDTGAGIASTIGRYRVLHQVGLGGVGVVYAALDEALGRTVALKLLRPRGDSDAKLERRRARLIREAQALARLSHPNIVPVYEVGELDGQVFVAMELVEGSTLRQWLRAGPRRWTEILDVCAQAGQALVAAHAAGIVHRDVKPDNLLIGRDGRVRLVDFGLATALSDESSVEDDAWALDGTGAVTVGGIGVARRPPSGPATIADTGASLRTGHGKILGTPAYMSPEQSRGEPVDARTDQYGFCVTVWEALIGERPPAERSPSSAHPPARILRALARGLELEPERRHPSMDALLTRLAWRPEAGRRLRWAALLGALLGALLTALALAWLS